MGKVVVNEEKCIGCGSCVGMAPNTFDWNDDGKSTVKNTEVTKEAEEASECCPTGAITIEK
jgi:ferredoxin